MVYRFTIVSDEVDDFIREIKIDGDASFFDLHKAILASCNYPDDQMTSFFICDEDWEKETEVTLEDMSTGSDEDSFVMKDTKLSDMLEDEKQRLLYVFDPLSDRVFFMELTEIEFSKDIDKPECSRQKGNAPEQLMNPDDAIAQTTGLDLGEDFYGADEFDSEDFDPEGFEITDGDPYANG